MAKRKYRLKFLPLFESDLSETVDYITYKLQNPTAANDLVDATEAAIYERLPEAETFAPYPSSRKRPYPYYYIPVKNFFVFYVVIGDVMEVRRFLYASRDIEQHI